MALDLPSNAASGGYGAAAATARKPDNTAGDPDREARVAELRQKYLEGQYTVNPHAVGKSLIADHLAENDEKK